MLTFLEVNKKAKIKPVTAHTIEIRTMTFNFDIPPSPDGLIYRAG
jgi:hypothetical protein